MDTHRTAELSQQERRRQRNQVVLTCAGSDCEIEFVRKGRAHKFCSDACSKRAYMARVRDRAAKRGMTSDGRSPQRRAKIRDRRALLIKQAGGCCSVCGYDRCVAALQFHHRDPEDKLFILSGSELLRSWEAIEAEVEKCDLICANCHVELHEAELRERIADAQAN